MSPRARARNVPRARGVRDSTAKRCPRTGTCGSLAALGRLEPPRRRRHLATMRRYFTLGLVLSALTLGRAASADDAATTEAQARFKEGLEYADAARFEEARLKF